MRAYSRLDAINVSRGLIVSERVEDSAGGIESYSVAHHIVIGQAGAGAIQ